MPVSATLAPVCGEVSEWPKEHAWKVCERKFRGFESHPHRH